MTAAGPPPAAGLVAAVSAPFDLPARPSGRDRWPDEPALLRRIADRFAAVAGQALAAGGKLGITARGTEIVLGTCCGTSRVAELLHDQLRLAGPKWIDPETFAYYSPHSLASAAAVAHGLGGAGTTLLGPGAGIDALGHAVRRLALGSGPVLVGGYEALTEVAAAGLRELGLTGHPARGDAVALLLAPAGAGTTTLTLHPAVRDHAAARRHAEAAGLPPGGVRRVLVTGTVPPGSWDLAAAFPAAEVSRASASSPAVAPLHAVAHAGPGTVVAHPGRAGHDLVLLS